MKEGSAECRKLVRASLRKAGFRPIGGTSKANANGTDVWARKADRIYRVEVKVARRVKNVVAQVRPVEPERRDDELIAVVMPSRYVLIEPMKDHLRNCSKAGYRSFAMFG